MSKWKTVRLGDVATYVNGFAFKPSDWTDTGLPIIRIQNLTGNDYETNYYSGEYNPKYEVVKGDILISWSASLGVYEWRKDKALLNQHIFKVVFDKVEIDKRYFIHTVSYLLDDMVKETHGSTMKHITKPRFDNTPFPYPPIETQQQIADTLDKLQSIITHRKQQLLKLDELVKARFVEMFGEPITNPKGWKMVGLGELTSVGSSKRIFEKEYVESGIPFYRTKEIVELSKGNPITTELFISEERYAEIKKQYGVPKKGDLLISAVGTIGIIWVVDGENDFYFKDGNLIRVDGTNRFNSSYMKCLLEYLIAEYKKQMSAGTAYAALTISGLSKMQVFDVPIDLQQQFAAFVSQTDKSKFSHIYKPFSFIFMM